MKFRKLPWEEHRLVWVQHEDGRWCEGWLEGWREDQRGWVGFVRYSTGIGETRLGSFDRPSIVLIEGDQEQ